MSARAKRSEEFESRLPVEHLEAWLEAHGFTWRMIEREVPIWPVVVDGETKKIPLYPRDIERMIAAKDPVIWAYLYLTEKQGLEVDGEVMVTAGSPWSLFPIQAELARVKGDLIVECGSEVGKTRDIILRALWRADTALPGQSISTMIGGDSDQTLMPIWEQLEFQLDNLPTIAGGLDESKCHIKPNRKKTFRNGCEIELRLAGHDGKNFRGGHFNGLLLADEAAKWKNPLQWSEFWRAGLPGSEARIYSTPDGDYSSPFFAMCARAVPVNGRPEESAEAAAARESGLQDGERRLLKFNIRKDQLPYPLWSEKRKEWYRLKYGGEHSTAYITNVLGRWGSPEWSVFPMPTLRPNLRFLPDYRLVVAVIDRDQKTVSFSAARLSQDLEREDGSGAPEEILAKHQSPMTKAAELGREIAGFFPRVEDWNSPVLFCGADLGSAQDPSEFVFVRVLGKKWIDVFRLHLRNADWPEQADVIVQLDHASGHRVVYSFDNGSAGTALVQALSQEEKYRTCPACNAAVYFAERLTGRGFGEKVDEIDPETGQEVLNPDARDAAGNLRPFRISNKEFSTRILERKAQGVELEVAPDAGAGDQRIAGPQLLVNHTAKGGGGKSGERKFRDVDDHHVDARRQVALAIVALLRGLFIPANEETVRGVGRRDDVEAGYPGISARESAAAAMGGGRVTWEGW